MNYNRHRALMPLEPLREFFAIKKADFIGYLGAAKFAKEAAFDFECEEDAAVTAAVELRPARGGVPLAGVNDRATFEANVTMADDEGGGRGFGLRELDRE